MTEQEFIGIMGDAGATRYLWKKPDGTFTFGKAPTDEEAEAGEFEDASNKDKPIRVHDPVAKARAEGEKRYRLKARRAEEQAGILAEQLADQRAENAFLVAAAKAGITDLPTALKLGDLSGVTVDDEGVHGIDEAVQSLLTTHPALVAPVEPTTPLPVSGRPMNARKRTDGLDRAALEKRYPALRNRR